MKKIILSFAVLSILALAVASCNNGKKTDPAKNNADSLIAINELGSYADSLKNTVTTMEGVLSNVYAAAALSRNSDSIETIYQPVVKALDKKMLDLTTNMDKLLQQKRISQETYEQIILDINMSRISEERVTLQTLGINL